MDRRLLEKEKRTHTWRLQFLITYGTFVIERSNMEVIRFLMIADGLGVYSKPGPPTSRSAQSTPKNLEG